MGDYSDEIAYWQGLAKQPPTIQISIDVAKDIHQKLNDAAHALWCDAEEEANVDRAAGVMQEYASCSNRADELDRLIRKAEDAERLELSDAINEHYAQAFADGEYRPLIKPDYEV